MQKYVKDSCVEQVHVLTMSNLNGYNRLFGGQLMSWIDEVAAVVARRHSGCNVTTASVDTLIFKKPAHANDTVIINGKITYAGNTSMEIDVKSYVEDLSGERTLINEAFITMVAIDENEKPTKIPALVLGTDEERTDFANAIKRKERRNTN